MKMNRSLVKSVREMKEDERTEFYIFCEMMSKEDELHEITQKMSQESEYETEVLEMKCFVESIRIVCEELDILYLKLLRLRNSSFDEEFLS